MTVDEVRKALDAMKTTRFTGGLCKIEQAFMEEGLKVLDDYAEVRAEYEKALKDRRAYPPLAALMAHYDATRPDWRTR